MNNYRIYSQAEFENKKNFLLIPLSFSYLKAFLIYKPKPFESSDVQHIEFYAESNGWEKFTESGYKSTFVFNENIYSVDELMDEFKTMFVEHGLNINSPQPEQIQLF